MSTTNTRPVAVVTGGSAGLGLALVRALANDGWSVITDGRSADRLAAVSEIDGAVVPIPGDVTDESHRRDLADAVASHGRLDLLVHNASDLGPSPLPPLHTVGMAELHQVWRTNVGAALELTGLLLSHLVGSRGILLSISSDAAVEHYEGWGLYAASKAASDHLTLTFGAENPRISAYAVDPGDMRTQMHQDAFPEEDISDRPLPETVVPHLRALLESRPPNGRYRAAEFPPHGADAQEAS